MADDKIRMPSSQGGLVNFSDDTKGKFEISPIQVTIIIAVVIVIILALHQFGAGFLGI